MAFITEGPSSSSSLRVHGISSTAITPNTNTAPKGIALTNHDSGVVGPIKATGCDGLELEGASEVVVAGGWVSVGIGVASSARA